MFSLFKAVTDFTEDPACSFGAGPPNGGSGRSHSASIGVPFLCVLAGRRHLAWLGRMFQVRDASLRSRLVLWHDSLTLIHDYGFTGIGSLDTGLVHATAVLPIPWVHLGKLHNVFLQTRGENGVLGAAGLVSGTALCA